MTYPRWQSQIPNIDSGAHTQKTHTHKKGVSELVKQRGRERNREIKPHQWIIEQIKAASSSEWMRMEVFVYCMCVCGGDTTTSSGI